MKTWRVITRPYAKAVFAARCSQPCRYTAGYTCGSVVVCPAAPACVLIDVPVRKLVILTTNHRLARPALCIVVHAHQTLGDKLRSVIEAGFDGDVATGATSVVSSAAHAST